MTLAERFWAKVKKRGPDECWTWIGNGEGYRVRQQILGRDIRVKAPSKKLADQIDASLTAQRLGLRYNLPQPQARALFGDWFPEWLRLLEGGNLTRKPLRPRTVEANRELTASLTSLEALASAASERWAQYRLDELEVNPHEW